MTDRTHPEALRSIQRFEVVDCIDSKHVPAVIPKPHGPWVRYADHVTALAAGQAGVQDDLITIRKPTTSAEMLWLLKLAHLVISDVDKTLEETFAPAQPAAPQGVAYAALPERVVSTQEICDKFAFLEGAVTETCYMRIVNVADSIQIEALRASHGQAPAQTDSVLYDPKAVLDVFNGARAGSEKPVGYLRGIRAVIAHWESRPEPHRWMVPAPAGATLPDGWVPLTITHEGQYPEEVAYGPQIMMDRLGKWLGKYFAQAAQADSVQEDAARLERERICAAIKAEDDYCVDHGDYMLDSDDCIKIVRGEWVRPDCSVDAARKQGEKQ